MNQQAQPNYKPIILIFAIVAIVLGIGISVYAFWGLGERPNDTPVAEITYSNYNACITDSSLDSNGCQYSSGQKNGIKCGPCYSYNPSWRRSCNPDPACSPGGNNNNPPPTTTTTTTAPPQQSCTPGQWFACGYGRCNDGQSAQCNSSGTDYNCYDDPATCSPGGNNNTTTSRSSSRSTSRASSSGGNNSSSGATSSSSSSLNPNGGNPPDVPVSGLPPTGILDENPYMMIGLALVLTGVFFTLISKRARTTSI